MSSGTNKQRIAQNNAKIEELIKLLKEKEQSSSGPNGLFNIEPLLETDENGKVTQTLKITDWDYEPAPKFDRVFANNTPAQIDAVSKEIASNGYTSTQVAEIYGWNLGDTIPITLSSGEKIEMQIIGFNHDTLSSDHTSKAGLTLQMKDCLTTLYYMMLVDSNTGGYTASKMKIEILPTIKGLLPQEWQDVIKLVDKKSTNGGSQNFSEVITSSEDLFLLSQIEVYNKTLTSIQNGDDEGTTYEYWDGKENSDRIKNCDSDADGVADTATIWWLRSCAKMSKLNYGSVSKIGAVNAQGASANRGVSFACCI